MKDKIIDAINNIKEKKSKILIYIPDTNGIATGGVKYLFDIAYAFHDDGYNTFLFHEKDEFIKPDFGKEYDILNTVSFKKMSTDKNYLLSASDFIFISELYIQGLVSQLEKLPCKIIAVSQAHDYIFHYMDIGISWDAFRIYDCLTTTQEQSEFINSFMNLIDNTVVNPYISDCFKPSNLPKKPYIAVVSRFPSDGDKVIKQFFLKHPLLSWIPFKALGQLGIEQFAKELSECAIALWIDESSSFGTFPLECMKTKTVVVGQIPAMIPEWMVEDGKLAKNGYWVANRLSLVDELAKAIDEFLHNETDNDIIKNGLKTVEKYSKNNFNKQAKSFIEKITNKRITELNKILEKYEDDNSNTNSQETE